MRKDKVKTLISDYFASARVYQEGRELLLRLEGKSPMYLQLSDLETYESKMRLFKALRSIQYNCKD